MKSKYIMFWYLTKILKYTSTFKKYIIFITFFPLPFSAPSNHHTVAHVHESFFFFAQSLHPLTAPTSSQLFFIYESVSISQALSLIFTYFVVVVLFFLNLNFYFTSIKGFWPYNIFLSWNYFNNFFIIIFAKICICI